MMNPASSTSNMLPPVASLIASAERLPKNRLKRKRTILSCQACHARKQQCDRERPCTRCIKRGTQDECVYDHPRQFAVQKLKSSKSPLAVPFDRRGGPATPSASPLEPNKDLGLKTLLQIVQGGAGPRNGNVSQETLQTHFPNHAITSFLLSHFFDQSSIHWLWSVIHRPVFDKCYMSFSSSVFAPGLDFLALLAIVCTSSLQFLPETAQDASIFSAYELGRHVLRERLYNFSRSVLIHDDAIAPSLERVQALALLALHQLNEGDFDDWYQILGIAIRMSQSLGMHRERPCDPIAAETRRRLWWTLFSLDRMQCLSLGRPYLIHNHHCDVEVPLNLDQVELCNTPTPQGQPLHRLTEHTFHIYQIRWAKLIGDMWDECFSIKTPSYSAIASFEDDIRKFELELPASFRSQSKQGSSARPYLLLQDHFLTLQIYHTRAILLRSFLIARLPAARDGPKLLEDFHSHAKDVCLMFCKRVLAWQLLTQTQINHSQLRWSQLAICIFDAALMLGVAILMDPQNEDNDELEEWIALALYLLRDMGPHNELAHMASRYIIDVRKRVQEASHSVNSLPRDDTIRYIQKATHTLAQPQRSVDLESYGALEHGWASEKVVGFGEGFPSVEVLSDSSHSQAVTDFLDGCIP